MGDTESAGAAVPPEEAGLALERSGTRFVLPETEAQFRVWILERYGRAIRAVIYASIAFWIVALILIAVVRPVSFAPWAVAIGVVFSGIGAMWVAIRARSVLAVELAGMALITLSGGVGIALANLHLNAHAVALAGAVWACFFHYTYVGVRSSRAAIATAPYMLMEAGFLWRDVGAGRLEAGLAAVEAFLVLSAFAVGLMGSIVAAAAARQSYRQERIIEAQNATIARERARSEASLKQEVSHQVAERSRELGVVLARSDTLQAHRLSPGERFDARYRVAAALGAGGMGAVYEVERMTDGQRLALKAIVGEVSGASAARFAREAEIGARVHHPNLVSIVDVGVSAGVPFLVMELVRGGSLESQRARFGDPSWALPILRQIGEGLAALHDAGVVHRDLKPANVLLAGDEAAPLAKISDFGISRFGAIDEGSATDPSAATLGASPSPKVSALTGTGVVMGTPVYMAPEGARGGRAVELPADVFALGIIAYEMLTGRPPFAVPAVLLAMADQQPPPAPPIDEQRVAAALCAAILQCLSIEPGKRPRVRSLLAALG